MGRPTERDCQEVDVSMNKIKAFFIIAFAVFGVCGCGAAENDDNVVIVYNWGEYIDPDMLEQFEAETGIRVIYDEFETNETMTSSVLPII